MFRARPVDRNRGGGRSRRARYAAALMRCAGFRGGPRRSRCRRRCSGAALSHKDAARLALLAVGCFMGAPILPALAAAHACRTGGVRAYGQPETANQTGPCHNCQSLLHAPGLPPAFVSGPFASFRNLAYAADAWRTGGTRHEFKRSMASRPLAIHTLRAC